LSRALGRFIASCSVAITILVPLADRGSAAPFASALADRPHQAMSLVENVHGFHCRKVLGWDPVAGVYHVHRHEGICRNYQRCLSEHKRCLFVLGKGWEPWTYERFGWDNYRYSGCMIRAGCY
jgi:hypothetical protein